MTPGAGPISTGAGAAGAGAAGHDERRAATPRATRLASAGRPVVATFVLAVAVGAAVRLWQMWGRNPLEWADTVDFLATSRSGWVSLGLWAGERPVGPALLLKAVGGDATAYVVVQAAIAVACWAALAASVVAAVAGRVARVLAAVAVVAFSVTSPVTMWDRSVLSESPGLSLLALVVAAGLQMARGATGRRAALLVVALVLWAVVRDTHATVALAGGAAVGVVVAVSWLVERHRRPRRAGAAEAADAGDGAPAPGRSPPGRRLWGAVAVGAVGLGVVLGWASSYGERHLFPLSNVYEVRVLPYPDRVAWFVDHGMPQGEVFAGPAARTPHVQENGVSVTYVAEDDAALAPWLAWLETDGRAAFARFVATHPSYLVFEPLRAPERAFNNALGDRELYAPLDMRHVPLVDGVLALPTAVVLAVATGVAGWLVGRGRWSPAMATGLAVVALAVPHGLVAWHSDGMETARHLVVPALQLHLGVLLMVIGLAPGADARTGGAGDDRTVLTRRP